MIHARTTAGPLAVVAVVVAAVGFVSQRGEAHKAITSKYTYNDDVFPIFKERCSRCHVEHGVAPMSLMTYKDAFPWAESIRAELVVILTWATGGNPQGNLNDTVPAVTLKNDWVMGAPDLAITLPTEVTVP